MPAAKAVEIWIVDWGMAAKIRPCLIITRQPRGDELDVFTVVARTTALRGTHWEIAITKPFLDSEGAFDVQCIFTVSSIKLERRPGGLASSEMGSILDLLAERFGL
jgi:mRNA interferase MazF